MNLVVPLVAVAALAALTWARLRNRGSGAGGQSAHFGFDGEPVRFMWVGEFATDDSGASRTARELLAGATQGLLGAPLDLRVRGASVAVSASDRLSVVVQTDDDGHRFVHAPGEARVTFEGPGRRTIQGAPARPSKGLQAEARTTRASAREGASRRRCEQGRPAPALGGTP